MEVGRVMFARNYVSNPLNQWFTCDGQHSYSFFSLLYIIFGNVCINTKIGVGGTLKE